MSHPPAHKRFLRSALAGIAAIAAAASVTTALPSPASAISSSYCNQSLPSGVQCYEGSGYRGWRYHQGSSSRFVPGLCVQSWTGDNYRSGSSCRANVGFYSFCNASAEPTANSSVNWGGEGSNVTLNGRASSDRQSAVVNNGC